MKLKVLYILFTLFLSSTYTLTTTTTNTNTNNNNNGQEKLEARDISDYNIDTFADDILQCNPRSHNLFTNGEIGVGECLKRRAVTHLLGLSSSYSSLGISDSVSLIPEPGAGRALPHYNEPPSIMEAMRYFLGHRILRWQLDTLYPGLVMRVGPMGVPEAGVVEFVLERLYDETDRAIGPGKVLVKRTLLPLLLGFKLKLTTLMPLLLGGFFLLATKAVFFSKLALLLGAIIGFKTLLFGGGPIAHAAAAHHHHGGGGGGLGGLFDFGGHYHNPYGPVSFKSADGGGSIPITNNDYIPREAKQEASEIIERVVSGKRNFSWE